MLPYMAYMDPMGKVLGTIHQVDHELTLPHIAAKEQPRSRLPAASGAGYSVNGTSARAGHHRHVVMD